MIGDVLMVGGAGVLGRWIKALIGDACARLDPAWEARPAGRDHPLEDLGRVEGPRRILFADHPDRLTIEALEGQRVPVLALIDDPVDSTRLTAEDEQCTMRHALARQTASAAGHYLLRTHAHALLVHRGTAGSARDVALSVLGHVGLPAAVPATLDAFCGPIEEPWSLEGALERRIAGFRALNTLNEVVSASDAAMVRGALSPLIKGAVSPETGPIVWPGRTFLFGDNQTPPPVVDLTGSARVIYYGPYFCLPPGRWDVAIVLAFTKEARGLPFGLNLLCNLRPVARTQFVPNGAGAFEGTFVLHHSSPEHSLEINLWTREAMIEGHIALSHMTFRRAGGAPLL